MARCGCVSTCACVVRGQAPIVVTGNGSIQQPYIIGLSQDGQQGCAAITACVAENLGPGLVYDAGSGDIQVRLSTDEGQTLRFGSDGGVLGTTGGPPIPETCLRGIDGLPEGPNLVGAKSLAALHNPYSSPYGVDYCLANGVDVMSFQVATSSDDVGVVADYWANHMSGGRSSIYVSQDIRQISSSAIQSMYNYAGDVDDPVPYQRPNPESTTDRDDRRGGWYGWLAPRYYQPLASDFLRQINGKAVALMTCYPQPDNSFGTEATHTRGAIRAALEHCAQNWAMVGVSEVENATTVVNAGLVPVMIPDGPNPTEEYGDATMPYTAEELTGAGIEWIILSDFRADSTFEAYQAAGLNVIMMGNSRHEQRERITTLGIRGALVMDPVYYRGPGGDVPYGYRSETDPWEHRRPATGGLTFRTDIQNVISSGGFVRGRAEIPEQGLILPAGFGDGKGRPSVLCGWECPITNAEEYTIRFDAKWNTLTTNSAFRAKMALLFGAETDRDTCGWPSDATENPRGIPEGQKTLYRAYQRQSGEIGIAKWATQDAEIEYLATQDGPAVVEGEWNSYSVVVSPTQITFTRTLADGSEVSVATGDTQYRGGYFFVEKEETFFGQDENAFEGKFRNIVYEAAS